MAKVKSRKDNRGSALRKGESQRSSDLMYASDLGKLRDKQDKLKKDQLDGLDLYAAGNATLNFVFDRYMSMKYNL